jgi:hypothetical protein
MRVYAWLFTLLLMLCLAACSGDDNESGQRRPTARPNTPQARVIVTQATVFTAPSRDAPVLMNLFEGDLRHILGKSAPDALGTIFYLLDLGNQTGWILETQVELRGDAALVALVDAPTLSPTPTTSPSPEPTQVVIVPTATASAAPTLTLSPETPLPPSPTATASPTLGEGTTEPTPLPTPTPFGFANDATSLRPGAAPPLTITLPDGWQAAHILVPITGSLASGDIRMTVYEGPLPDGMTGHIWVVWGFPNILPLRPGEEFQVSLWADSIQYLRGLLFTGCNIGLFSDNRRPYTIGGYEGEGTTYSAVSCEGASDIAGWFVGLQANDVNFVFYMGVEPVEAVSNGLTHLQAILDTVSFVQR